MGVDQTLLTAAILNLAINARNAMLNGGTHETRRLGNAREGGSDRETHAVGAAGRRAGLATRPCATASPINGLPILSVEADLDTYYFENTIGGPGAIMVCRRTAMKALPKPS